MTEYEKVSITLPRELVKAVKARAGSRGFSAYVAEALRLEEHMADLDTYLAWADEKFGPIPPEAIEEAEREWQRAASPAPKRRVARSSSTAKG